MTAGLYNIINGEIVFEPTLRKIRIKKICYVKTFEGQIFGHEYSYETSICIYYPSFSKNNLMGGYGVIDLGANEHLLSLARENDNTLQFDDDIIIDDKYVIKAG